MKMLKIGLIFSFAAAFAAACGQPASSPNIANTFANVNKTAAATPIQSASPIDEIAMARNLYTINCMTCHKDSGKGGKTVVDGKSINPDDLTSDKMKAKTDEKLISYVTDGIPDEGMPAFKDKMTGAEIKAVVKHVRSLQK